MQARCVAFLANLTAYPLKRLAAVHRRTTAPTRPGLISVGEFAISSLAGSIVLSLIRDIRVARLMIGATVVWYATLLIFVQMQTVPTAIACLVVAGFSQSLAMISIAVILMRTASENFRGRVMGVRMMVIYGLPIGLLAAGSLIDEIGFAATGTLYAAAGLALMLAVVLHWRADLWHVHAPANAR
jgi:predicted MFS family arabinose efflux permease